MSDRIEPPFNSLVEHGCDPPCQHDQIVRALLTEHRRYCGDFYCNCRDDEDADDE